MTERILYTKGDIDQFATFLKGRKLPVTVSVQSGKHRTIEQNRLQRLWLNEIAEQLGDRTPEEVRGFCKLCFGVPLLRAENDTFRERYDRVLKPLDYETKLEIMMEPLDLPVTRLMTTVQKVRYLDQMQQYFIEQGLVLTEPSPEFASYQSRYRKVERA